MKGHGTNARYASGCRCNPCRLAHNAHTREHHRRKMRALDPRWTPERPAARHGTNSKYAAGCRCGACTEAHGRYRTLQNRRDGFRARVAAAPTRALMGCMIGHTPGVWPGATKKTIARATGCSEVTLALKRGTTLARTAERVERLHWALYRTNGLFRCHCRCELPGWMVEWLEAS